MRNGVFALRNKEYPFPTIRPDMLIALPAKVEYTTPFYQI
jgi:hypothetical protein